MTSSAASQKRPPVKRKGQVENQLAGRRGELVASFCFPEEWVVRPLPHDFGLDLEVEPFYEIESGEHGQARFETRGEHLYVQVKTVDDIYFGKPNVPGASASSAYRLSIETSELLLAAEMGPGVPILLLLVHRSSGSVYFVCLTDYVEKILDTASPRWRSQKSASVWIPERNRLTWLDSQDSDGGHVQYFSQLARRGKYFSVFNYLWRAKSKIDNCMSLVEFAEPRAEYFRQVTAGFHAAVTIELSQLLRLDVWGLPGNFPAVQAAHRALLSVQDEYRFSDEQLSLERLLSLTQSELKEFVESYRLSAFTVGGLFDSAASLGATFETVLRLAYLPTEYSDEM